MHRINARQPEKFYILLAAWLLAGLILVSTGFYSSSNPILFIGILLIIGGVLNGIIRIINRD